MSDITSTPPVESQADHSRIAEAALKRFNQSKTHSEEESAELRYERERPVRRKFRRLADPGIVRNNNEADTKKAFEILLKLSQNLLSDPENPKFREFKSTNAMGFRAAVEDFQPKYVWHPTPENLVALRVGAEIIREHTELAAAKEQMANKSKQTIAEEKAAAVQKALLAFEDDRKTKKLLDARMKTQPPMSPMRSAPSPNPPQSPQFKTQGSGETLGGPSPRRGFTGEGEDTTVQDPSLTSATESSGV
ncbi:hypothetical protein FRC06_002132 [Ceratobasidium sp. 370]|nr:hypothetical protein FRC06_002132 [Ceratobasidium sp. 370]